MTSTESALDFFRTRADSASSLSSSSVHLSAVVIFAVTDVDFDPDRNVGPSPRRWLVRTGVDDSLVGRVGAGFFDDGDNVVDVGDDDDAGAGHSRVPVGLTMTPFFLFGRAIYYCGRRARTWVDGAALEWRSLPLLMMIGASRAICDSVVTILRGSIFSIFGLELWMCLDRSEIP